MTRGSGENRLAGAPAPAMTRLTGAAVRLWSTRGFVHDWSVVVLAAAVVAGTRWPVPVPAVAPGVAASAAWALRRPLLLVLVAPVLAGALAHGALTGAAPAAAGRIDASALVVSDPEDSYGGAVRAVVRADGRRYQLHARGGSAGHLRRALAGETLVVTGRVRPRRAGEDWLLVRHVIGHIEADHVRLSGPGDPASRLANAFRRLLDRGAEPLDPEARALFTGFTLGDDRFQDDATIEDFRATGLSHLLAVSGQNVAFVLVVLRPLLARTALRPRLALIIAAVSLFAVMTRLEPSVLRAATMTLIATLGATLGRPVASLRVLALAVAVLVLIDPLLVDALGFRLSVAASAGIVVLAPVLGSRLPGPRPVAEALAVTLAAQVAVAPLLLGPAGGVPVVALPANLLAAPASAPLMVWGLSGGAAAGLLGGVAAQLLHLPTAVLLWWVRAVSSTLARLPLGSLGGGHLAALAAVAAAAGAARVAGVSARLRDHLAGAAAAAVVVVAALSMPSPPPGPVVPLGPGAELWLAEAGASALVVDGRARGGVMLDRLRTAGVRSVDVIVSRSPSRTAARTVRLLADRLGPVAVIGPEGLAQPGALNVETELVTAWNGLELQLRPDGERLEVTARVVEPAGVASVGASPVPRSRAPPPRSPCTGRPGGAVARRPPLRCGAPCRGDGDPQPHTRLVL